MSSDWTPDFGNLSIDPPQWKPKRPVRIAILGDFSAGALSGRLETGAELARRKPLNVEFDTLEDAMSRLQLELTLPLGAKGAPVSVEVSELESFHPDELYRNLKIFSALSSLRKRLNTPATFAAAAAEVQGWGKKKGRRASSVSKRSKARGAAPSSSAKLDDFARLTGRPAVTAGADDSLDALLHSLVGPFVVEAPNPQKDAMLETVDKALADTMRAVLHQPDFQNAESLWRGVDFLLRRLETSHQLQVHLIDISAEEFAADLSSTSDLSETGLYKLLVDQPSQAADGGYTYLCGCYQFDASPPHAELLGRMAQVAAQAGAPFITGMTTDPFSSRKEPHPLIQEAFTALRDLPQASHLCLMGPRFMLRHPYGKRSDPISSFAFEEFTREDGLSGMLWGHPGLLALCVLGLSGGQPTINDLAFHHYVDADGDSVALPCTDRLINTNLSTALRRWGIASLLAHKGEPMVRISGLEAVNGGELRQVSGSSASLRNSVKVSVSSTAKGKPASSGKAAAASTDEDASDGSSFDSDMDFSSDSSDSSGDMDFSSDSDSDSSSSDSDLDALLAGLGGGDTDSESSSDDSGSGDDSEMDPDLAALLASLN